MSVLDLTGPEFLRFYVPYGLCILALAWLLRAFLAWTASAPPSTRWTPGVYPREHDAYAIAFLRGGSREVVQTVLGRLVSARLVNVEDRQVTARPAIEKATAQLLPVEELAWSALPETPLDAEKAERQIKQAIGSRLQDIEKDLAHEGLLPSRERKTTFRALAVVAWLAVGGLGLAKLAVALARGRSNVGFLVLLLLGITLLTVRLLRPPHRMRAGKKYLEWLQESHRGLVNMLESGRREAAGEVALAAGIYGITAVPGLTVLYTALQPVPPQRRNDSSSSGGCGSSASSDSGGGGSSCGGGCGGGGCGGCGG